MQGASQNQTQRFLRAALGDENVPIVRSVKLAEAREKSTLLGRNFSKEADGREFRERG